MQKTQKIASVSAKLARKDLIGFDTLSWGKDRKAIVGESGSKHGSLTTAKIGTKSGVKPPTGQSAS